MLDNEEDNNSDRILAKALKSFYSTKGREIIHKSNLNYAYMLDQYTELSLTDFLLTLYNATIVILYSSTIEEDGSTLVRKNLFQKAELKLLARNTLKKNLGIEGDRALAVADFDDLEIGLLGLLVRQHFNKLEVQDVEVYR